MRETIRSARGALGAAVRHHGDDAEAVDAARQQLKAATAEDYIRRLVDGAPPLTDSQRSRLAVLLLNGRAA